MSMFRITAVVLFSFVISSYSINRPVYKIALHQKGFTQFLQYDIETPPLREFTFCTWIRVFDLVGDQSIFTYVANGNNRIIRLWLDSGGRYMKLSFDGRLTSSIPVEIIRDVWRHVCLSYQSDYGAWALYIDARLVSCEASQYLYAFVIPRGGSVIIGYGTADDGAPNGLEGEIFGANMILISTIERNYTVKKNPLYEQKSFHRNMIRNTDKNIKYVVLSDLQSDELQNNFEKALFPNTTRSFIKINTPYTFVEHDVGIDLTSKRITTLDSSNEKEILDLSTAIPLTTDKNSMNFWTLINQAGQTGQFRVRNKSKAEQSGLGTQDKLMISEYETPPPPGPPNQEYLEKGLEMERPPVSKSIYKLSDDITMPVKKTLIKQRDKNELSEIETPPPPDDTNNKVYGQWTSSKFAGTVLNYLKSINFHYKEPKKVPPTIPLAKISDSFPYSSEFKLSKLRPPLQFQRKQLIENRLNIKRHDTYKPQINVQILEDDLRSNILKSHAQTHPKLVDITSRGEGRYHKERRFYRHAENTKIKENADKSNEKFLLKPPVVKPNMNNRKKLSHNNVYKNENLLSILPFLKSSEYFIEDSANSGTEKNHDNNDMYSKSLANGNKWHNVKSYSNDYTPRRINIEMNDEQTNIDERIEETNKKHPSIRLKYKYENKKLVQNDDDVHIQKGRALALEVSNQSDYNKDTISILKYNHGYLPSHDNKHSEQVSSAGKTKRNKVNGKNNFDKHIKIGNALNERHIIGFDDDEKRQSFVGGDEKIPDINKYRSTIDNENIGVPSSLGPRICKNIELYDRVLYVQPDESIDMTHIMSPIRQKNIGIEFIIQNYKKCSFEESPLEKHSLLLIDWSKTPVRLFGGAYPRRTTDLCGFF